MLRAYDRLGRMIYRLCRSYIECNDAMSEEHCRRMEASTLQRYICPAIVWLFTVTCLAVNRCWDYCVFIG